MSTEKTTPIIQTHALTKIFAQKKIAVNDLYLEVPENSIFGFLGPNGAGKTTTIKMLLGLTHPSAGSISIFGRKMVPDAVELRKHIGYLPTHALYPEKMTPIRYLDFIGKLFRLSKEIRVPRISELIRSTDLLGLSASEINKFSTGETTRLGIAACLINDPRLLILDEPTTGLDPIGRASAINLIRELGKDPTKTIFISSHILADIERFCTHVGIISNGKLIFKGTITDVKRLIHHNAIFLELEGEITQLQHQISQIANIANVELKNQTLQISLVDPSQYKETLVNVFRLVSESPVDLISFNSGSETLEEAFLHLLEEEKSHGFLRGVIRKA